MSWNFNKLIFGLEIRKKTSKICDIRKCIESGNFLVQILELKEIRKGNLLKLNWTSNIYLEKSKWMVKRSKAICWLKHLFWRKFSRIRHTWRIQLAAFIWKISVFLNFLPIFGAKKFDTKCSIRVWILVEFSQTKVTCGHFHPS